MSEERFKASHFENIEDLLENIKLWIINEDIYAFHRFFDFGAMEELFKELTKYKDADKDKLTNEIEQLRKDYDTLRQINMRLNDNWDRLEERLKQMAKTLNPDDLSMREFELQHDGKNVNFYLTIIYVLTMMTEIKEGVKDKN